MGYLRNDIVEIRLTTSVALPQPATVVGGLRECLHSIGAYPCGGRCCNADAHTRELDRLRTAHHPRPSPQRNCGRRPDRRIRCVPVANRRKPAQPRKSHRLRTRPTPTPHRGVNCGGLSGNHRGARGHLRGAVAQLHQRCRTPRRSRHPASGATLSRRQARPSRPPPQLWGQRGGYAEAGVRLVCGHTH